MWRGRGLSIQFLLHECCVLIYYVVCLCIIKLVEILNFDGLISKCCFFLYVKQTFECCGSRFE